MSGSQRLTRCDQNSTRATALRHGGTATTSAPTMPRIHRFADPRSIRLIFRWTAPRSSYTSRHDFASLSPRRRRRHGLHHPMSAHDRYSSPLSERYASRAMVELWSLKMRYGLWRRLWLALAEAQRDLGLEVPDAALD